MESVKAYTIPFEVTYEYTYQVGKFFKRTRRGTATLLKTERVFARNLRRAVRKAHLAMDKRVKLIISQCQEAHSRNQLYRLTGRDITNNRLIAIDNVISIEKVSIRNRTEVSETKIEGGN